MARPWKHGLVIAMAAAVSLAGCGEDEGGGGSAADQQKAKDENAKKIAAKKKAAADRKKKSKIKVEVASFIPTLERTVPPEEATTIRRRLKERDFVPDPLGTENRDPFRSFLLPQLGRGEVAVPIGPVTVRPTDACTRNKLVATSYPLRDLVLIGIVVRGAQRFALFRDAKGVGHMVERGRCLGRERAVITEIGDGHVTIEIMPEAVPGGPDPVAEKRSIPLYANELTVDDLAETEDTPTEPAPPAAVTPPPGAENL